MWLTIAEPVLSALGHAGCAAHDAALPRVWWCPTGPLTVLPLHAAGRYPRTRTRATWSQETVPGHVISSYIPTLHTLIRAQQPPAPAAVRHLTVAMPTTPGDAPLPAVAEELDVLARYFPPGKASHRIIGPQATRASVLDMLPTHSWVHMACHAAQQHADPSRSGFALWDSALTISDLAGQPVHQRDLAFLSACQTAAGSVDHLDEAIHLAAAMHFLGYRHVIATMWTVADSPAPDVAGIVYALLTQPDVADASRAAQAVHQVICALRQSEPADPLRWAPYIHIGP